MDGQMGGEWKFWLLPKKNDPLEKPQELQLANHLAGVIPSVEMTNNEQSFLASLVNDWSHVVILFPYLKLIFCTAILY